MSLVISIAEFLQVLYEYVPKELVIIIMASLTMFIFLEHADRKREREWQEEYTKINTHVFDGKLAPFNEILIKDLARQNCIGQVVTWTWKRKGTQQFWLEMLPTYKDKKEFVDTLAHECIHLYQMANQGDTGNHNDMFYSFRPKLNAIGLDI